MSMQLCTAVRDVNSNFEGASTFTGSDNKNAYDQLVNMAYIRLHIITACNA